VEKEISFRRGGVLKRLREPGFSYKTWEKELGRAGGLNETKCKGRSRKPLAEVFSLERPIARHFVCCLLKHPRCHSQSAENTSPIFWKLGRNCPLGGKIYRL
jgi:hypothetical protein